MPKLLSKYTGPLLVGWIEGLIIPLTLFCFLAGINGPHTLVTTLVITGFVGLLLALGGYFTRREEMSKTYDKRIQKVYQGLDVQPHIKEALIQDAEEEKTKWENAWKHQEANTQALLPGQYASCILVGVLIGGSCIAINTVFLSFPKIDFFIGPIILLAITGYFKYRMFGRPAFGGAILTALSGLAAALGAYGLSMLF